MEFLIQINEHNYTGLLTTPFEMNNTISLNCFTNDVINVSNSMNVFFGALNNQFVEFSCLTTKKKIRY
jgi:hypothetical protein